jgi:hypothetical protein
VVAAVDRPFHIAEKDVHPSGAIGAARIPPTARANPRKVR